MVSFFKGLTDKIFNRMESSKIPEEKKIKNQDATTTDKIKEHQGTASSIVQAIVKTVPIAFQVMVGFASSTLSAIVDRVKNSKSTKFVNTSAQTIKEKGEKKIPSLEKRVSKHVPESVRELSKKFGNYIEFSVNERPSNDNDEKILDITNLLRGLGENLKELKESVKTLENEYQLKLTTTTDFTAAVLNEVSELYKKYDEASIAYEENKKIIDSQMDLLQSELIQAKKIEEKDDKQFRKDNPTLKSHLTELKSIFHESVQNLSGVKTPATAVFEQTITSIENPPIIESPPVFYDINVYTHGKIDPETRRNLLVNPGDWIIYEGDSGKQELAYLNRSGKYVQARLPQQIDFERFFARQDLQIENAVMPSKTPTQKSEFQEMIEYLWDIDDQVDRLAMQGSEVLDKLLDLQEGLQNDRQAVQQSQAAGKQDVLNYLESIEAKIAPEITKRLGSEITLPQRDLGLVVPMKGIKNIGNSCYINSTMQALLSNPAFKDLIMQPVWPGVEDLEGSNKYADAKRLQSAVQTFVSNLEASRNPNDMVSAASSLREAIYDMGIFRKESKGRQQDAAQLVELILSMVGFVNPYETIREAGPDTGRSSEVLGVLPVPIKLRPDRKPVQMQSLIDSLFTTTNVFDNWKTYSQYKETVRLGSTPPDQVVLQLKRFRGDAYSRNKIDDDIMLPRDHILDLSKGFRDAGPESARYKVTGAIHHGGDIGGGHYRAFTLKNGLWYEASDSVTAPAKNIEKELAGSYILILEKVK